MKKISFLLLLGFFAFCSVGQNQKITNAKVSENILYKGIKNPVNISIPGLNPEKILVIADSGELTGLKGKYFYFIASDTKLKNVNLTIYKIIKPGVNKKIEIRNFVLKNCPVPSVVICNNDSSNVKCFDGGNITLNELKTLENISIKMQGIPGLLSNYQVVKFKFVTASKSRTNVIDGKNGNLTGAMKAAIGELVEGDMLIITDVYGEKQGNPEVRMPGALTLTVKQ